MDALLKAGATNRLNSRIYNVGGPMPLSMSEIATILCRSAGAPMPVLRPFPRERARIDIGSYITDSKRIARDLGWSPQTSFEHGTSRTLAFFRAHLSDYLDPSLGEPKCALQQPVVLKRTTVSA